MIALENNITKTPYTHTHTLFALWKFKYVAGIQAVDGDGGGCCGQK